MNAEFSEHRIKMVDGQVRTTDVTNAAILAGHAVRAARGVRRARRRKLAYIDEDIQISPRGGSPGPAI